MGDLRTELAQMMDETEWNWLIPHAKRDALVIVTPNLDLLEVAVAIANDNVTAVQHWIGEQLISKPSADQLAIWNRTPTKRFTALIVQPYVLVQEGSAVTAP
ncbi:MAG TPA: DUF2288 domain-containing protein [Candidatus Caenarcaniphilales bacterium]